MAGTVRTEAYKCFLNALIKLRNSKGLSQAELASYLGKPPSFVGKYEQGERRLDVVETFVILKALDTNPSEFLNRYISNLPEKL